ncbi:MAG: histidine kinase [Bacteroidales bacterium]|jgi:sensor histidine kinase YesM|nr:histidine kinase [Bacteroidales bacterium]
MKKYIEPFIHALIWGSGFFLIISQVKTIGPFRKIDGTFLYPVIFGTIISIILFYTNALVLIRRYSKHKNAYKLFAFIILLLLTITFFETVIDYFCFIVYHSTEKESFLTQFVTNIILNLFITALSLGYGLTKHWLKNEKNNQILMKEKLSAELDFLKAQLNPHFLFNILNMAFSSAKSHGDEKTADMIEKLSSLMRYMLYESNVDKIELSKEIEYIENYINLQKLRLSDDLPVNINFTIDGDIHKNKIAPLILIPFVENAFKHGVKFGKESEITIELKIHQNNFQFSIENIIHNSLKNLEKNSGLGLNNVKKRLSIIYPDKHTLHITRNNKFSVHLKITL